MQTIIETPTFQKAARQAGMTGNEVAALVNFIAANPDAGDAIQGSGGCRKVRIAGRGKGKSGGYRLITFYSGAEIPVFLLTIYSKGAVGNLTDAQVKTLKVLTKTLVENYEAS